MLSSVFISLIKMLCIFAVWDKAKCLKNPHLLLRW